MASYPTHKRGPPRVTQSSQVLPKSLGELTQLQHLDVSQNCLMTLPKEIGHLYLGWLPMVVGGLEGGKDFWHAQLQSALYYICMCTFICIYIRIHIFRYLWFFWIFVDFSFCILPAYGKFGICIKTCLSFLVLSMLKRSNQKSLIRSRADCQLCHNYGATWWLAGNLRNQISKCHWHCLFWAHVAPGEPLMNAWGPKADYRKMICHERSLLSIMFGRAQNQHHPLPGYMRIGTGMTGVLFGHAFVQWCTPIAGRLPYL